MDFLLPRTQKPRTKNSRAAAKRTDADDAESRARAYLVELGRTDHPAADDDPIRALFELATDYRCTASGWRGLYRRAKRHLA